MAQNNSCAAISSLRSDARLKESLSIRPIGALRLSEQTYEMRLAGVKTTQSDGVPRNRIPVEGTDWIKKMEACSALERT